MGSLTGRRCNVRSPGRGLVGTCKIRERLSLLPIAEPLGDSLFQSPFDLSTPVRTISTLTMSNLLSNKNGTQKPTTDPTTTLARALTRLAVPDYFRFAPA